MNRRYDDGGGYGVQHFCCFLYWQLTNFQNKYKHSCSRFFLQYVSANDRGHFTILFLSLSKNLAEGERWRQIRRRLARPGVQVPKGDRCFHREIIDAVEYKICSLCNHRDCEKLEIRNRVFSHPWTKIFVILIPIPSLHNALEGSGKNPRDLSKSGGAHK